MAFSAPSSLLPGCPWPSGDIKTDGARHAEHLSVLADRVLRTSFFLIGFYTFSLVCIVLILKFGVLDAIHPPSKTVRGMFMLASGIAGIVGGGIAIFFWKGARYLIGAWGGLALGWWIQCFRDGGLITNVGLRWVLYIGQSDLRILHYSLAHPNQAALSSASFSARSPRCV